MKASSLRDAISIALLAIAAGAAGLAPAQEPAADPAQGASTGGQAIEAEFNIPAQDLAGALDRFGSQAGIELVYRPELLAGTQARALSGRMGWQAALGQLLQGSGLEYRQASDGTVVIRRSGDPGRAVETSPVAATPAAGEDGSVTDMQGMTVTGTRIRGGATPSPVITIGAENIREEGFTDLGEVIRSIPQNFSGGQNPGVINGTASTNANQNWTGGSGLNLRGLGPDATLTLLNGRRLSYSGPQQAVDISAIPVEAVERLEIVPDGASAIYGSDAVGGVANVILKRDYQGVTVGARYGGATDGGLDTREYTATGGTTWSTGGLITTWKKTSGDPIFADQRDYTENMYDPATLYSGNGLRSGLLSAYQLLGDVAELRIDALRTVRDMDYYYGYSTYHIHNARETSSSLVSPSIEISLPSDWALTIGGAWGEDESVNDSRSVRETGVTTAGTLFGNKSHTYEAGAEGPLFAFPGGDVRLAVGAGYRFNEFQQRDLVSGTVSADSDDSSRFAYAEVSLPFVSSTSNIMGIRRLEVSAAVRGEDYKSFGGVTTPKLGLIYSPSVNLTLRTSWGKSFKAPTLLQQYGTYFVYLYPATLVGGTGYPSDATVLMPYGGNPDLKAERARTWSASLAFHPEAIPGLQAELTWFDIDYTDRVLLPIAGAAEALRNPIYEQFVSYYPTTAEQVGVIATSVFSNFSGAAYDPSNVVAIASNRYINVARQQINGLDLSGSYLFDLDSSRLTVRGSVSWLESTQQTTAVQSAHDLAGTLFNPAKLNSRLGAVWSRGGFTASSFVNYTGGVTDTMDDNRTASFTTLDAALRYDTGERNGVLSGLAFDVSGQNLFNRAPPLFTPTSATAAPYDSTNYSAIGRFVSLSVSKHF